MGDYHECTGVWVMIFMAVTVRVVVNDIHDFDMLGLVHKMVRGGMLTSGHFYDQCWYRKCV